MKQISCLALLSGTLLCGLPAAAQSGAQRAGPPADLAGTYEFLVSERATHHGALYRAAGPPDGLLLPYSFLDTGPYWGEYVCRLKGVNCAVTDYYDPQDYAIKARDGQGAALQAERINVHNGSNIYDTAVWQIAVVLGAAVHHFGHRPSADVYALASHPNQVLARTEVIRDVPTGRRATTRDTVYLYNGTPLTDPRSAYAFRMTTPSWLAPDPLTDSRQASLITVGALPRENPAYQAGRVAWSDWKPVTGDNAWAFLVGPLQGAYLHYVKVGGGRCVPFEEPAVQNALGVLTAFAALQSASGAVYYAPAGTLQNQGGAVNPYYVSIENNLSLFAGLGILQATLSCEQANPSTLDAPARARLAGALRLTGTMLAGGSLPAGRSTRGLKAFLHEHAWHEGGLVTGGYADEPGVPGGWRAVPEPKAVDVNTWGIAALGSAQIDAWFGWGASYRVWDNLKRWGAYGEGKTLWGVGYSDADGNGMTPEGSYRAGVLSAEWTAGAIVMVRNMIRHYQSVPRTSPDVAQATAFVAQLKIDEAQMLEGIQHLRFSQYLETDFPGKPPGYGDLISEPASPVRSEPYLYASRRHLIPFGWYANPIPSTASSAWAILVADHYDPFGYGGLPN